MLSSVDVAGYNLPDLADRLNDAALHQDRCRRQAARFEVPPEFTETLGAVQAMDAHAAAIAEGARFVAMIATRMAEVMSRPAAPVVQLLPSPTANDPPHTASMLARRARELISPANE